MLIIFESTKLFFKDMTSISTTFLAGSSAVIAALLALTTIIFSQFNERLIQKTSDISRDVQVCISENSDNYQSIISKINEIIYLLSNQSVYKVTLYFFCFVSYLSGFLWIISGVGNLFEISPLNYGDVTIIVLSTIAISLTFFVLPIILIRFNRRPVLKIDSKNRASFYEIKKYFDSIARISVTNVIKHYIQPTLSCRLGSSGVLILSLKHEIPISKVTYIFEFVGFDNDKQLIKITNDSSENLIEYEINPSNKNGNSFEGLFNLIQGSNYQNIHVYSTDKGELLGSFRLKFLINTEIEFVLSIYEHFKTSPDSYVTNILGSKKWIHRIQGDCIEEYKLKKK
ncbi:hypothetical protein [Bacillus thuringiensis]|uniref:hypothetical protein n=1 Tax=Bacillus thuringiensis TaxID=1428 RepID=UPI0011453027|nr:hypothetical protein [Bacillus thuringiensis]